MAEYLVFGKNGQVANSLAAVLPNAEFIDSERVDLAITKNIIPFLKTRVKPRFIINSAAYTAVDKAEAEPELCNKINHLAVAEMAKYAAENNIILVHYSTDYVFDGSGNQPFTEDNIANLQPLNIYGKSKLAAEQAIIKSGCKYYILRTSWVYSAVGNNFVKTMLRLASKPELKIVNDQIGCPTYAEDIAVNTLKLLRIAPEFGIYHFTGSEQISWFDFAKMIIPAANIMAIPTAEYPTPAKRPLNSRLNTNKIENIGICFPKISESLNKCLCKLAI